jgi:hypothetical protein
MHLSNGFAARSLSLAIGSPVTMTEGPAHLNFTTERYGQAPVTATSRTVAVIRLKGTKE